MTTSPSPTISTTASPTATPPFAPPACAKPCIVAALTATSCNALDFHCICASSTFMQTVGCCTVKTCSKADKARTLVYGSRFCQNFGVAIPVPDEAVACATVNVTVPVTATGTGAVAGALVPTSSTSPSSSSPQRFSPQAIAATAIATSLLFLALLVLAWFFYRRRHPPKAPCMPPAEVCGTERVELPKEEATRELGGMPVSELDGSSGGSSAVDVKVRYQG